MSRSKIRKDQRDLNHILKKYGKEDTLKYIKENFDEFDDTEDYTDIASNWDHEIKDYKELQNIICKLNGVTEEDMFWHYPEPDFHYYTDFYHKSDDKSGNMFRITITNDLKSRFDDLLGELIMAGYTVEWTDKNLNNDKLKNTVKTLYKFNNGSINIDVLIWEGKPGTDLQTQILYIKVPEQLLLTAGWNPEVLKRIKSKPVTESFDDSFADNETDYTDISNGWDVDAEEESAYRELYNILMTCQQNRTDYFRPDIRHYNNILSKYGGFNPTQIKKAKDAGEWPTALNELIRLETNPFLMFSCGEFERFYRLLTDAGYTVETEKLLTHSSNGDEYRVYWFKKLSVRITVTTRKRPIETDDDEYAVEVLVPLKIFTYDKKTDKLFVKDYYKINESFEDSFSDDETDYTGQAEIWDRENWINKEKTKIEELKNALRNAFGFMPTVHPYNLPPLKNISDVNCLTTDCNFPGSKFLELQYELTKLGYTYTMDNSQNVLYEHTYEFKKDDMIVKALVKFTRVDFQGRILNLQLPVKLFYDFDEWIDKCLNLNESFDNFEDNVGDYTDMANNLDLDAQERHEIKTIKKKLSDTFGNFCSELKWIEDKDSNVDKDLKTIYPNSIHGYPGDDISKCFYKFMEDNGYDEIFSMRLPEYLIHKTYFNGILHIDVLCFEQNPNSYSSKGSTSIQMIKIFTRNQWQERQMKYSIKESFEDSFNGDETDYTDVMDRSDTDAMMKALIKMGKIMPYEFEAIREQYSDIADDFKFKVSDDLKHKSDSITFKLSKDKCLKKFGYVPSCFYETYYKRSGDKTQMVDHKTVSIARAPESAPNFVLRIYWTGNKEDNNWWHMNRFTPLYTRPSKRNPMSSAADVIRALDKRLAQRYEKN